MRLATETKTKPKRPTGRRKVEQVWVGTLVIVDSARTPEQDRAWTEFWAEQYAKSESARRGH